MHGSASRNYDVLGRSLMNPDEVRNMDNKNCLIFIKGFNPIFDEKYWPFAHKNFKQTEDGGAKPYTHNVRKGNNEFQTEVRENDSDLREEITTRLCTMDFSEEQLKEAGKALEMNVRPEYLIEYLKPETSVEEMKDKLKKYQER